MNLNSYDGPAARICAKPWPREAPPDPGIDEKRCGVNSPETRSREGVPDLSKRLVRDVTKLAMDAAFTEMAERSACFFASDEAREGLAAFAEKRQPRWARED
jgi:enoyl-CoA hydratase/carnithine racemase